MLFSLGRQFYRSTLYTPQCPLHIFLFLFFMFWSIHYFCYGLPIFIFYSKIVLFILHPCAIITNMLVEYSLIILERPVSFVLLDTVPVPFESSFFKIFWFIYFNWVVRLVCSCLLGFSSFHWVLVCHTFLSTFTCCQRVFFLFCFVFCVLWFWLGFFFFFVLLSSFPIAVLYFCSYS